MKSFLPPAQQLQSVATRHRHPLVHARRVDWPRHTPRPRYTASSASDTVEMAGGGELWRDPRTARVEAVLFVAREPLGLRKIAQFASLADATEARTLIRRLNQLYDRGASSFRVEEVASGFQLLSRRKFVAWLRRVHQTTVETRLSSPALETLAVVAYRQPVLRATIESIRGVQCGEMLRQLMERDLAKIVGRSDDLGRPFLYGTTKRFLQVFGLRHLDELPRAQSLRQDAGELANQTISRSIDSTEESDVSIAAKSGLLTPDSLEEEQRLLHAMQAVDEEEADDDLDDDEDDDDEDDDEEDDDEEGFEDSDWEEVDDDEEDEEEEEKKSDEDEDWDDDDDEDEDDWDDDEEDDDDEEEEEWEEEA